jgi:hypothetical protein
LGRRAGRRRHLVPRRHASARAYIAREDLSSQIAAAQPHRRGVDNTASALAESVLGRLFLGGKITEDQLYAGKKFAQRWGAYRFVLGGPTIMRSPSPGPLCFECEEITDCLCVERKAKYRDACHILRGLGFRVFTEVVNCACLELACDNLSHLRRGLDALDRFFLP